MQTRVDMLVPLVWHRVRLILSGHLVVRRGRAACGILASPLEFLSAHGALALGSVLLDPLHNTMHVKVMTALSVQKTAVIAWKLAGRTSAIKLDLTDTTDVILGKVPTP